MKLQPLSLAATFLGIVQIQIPSLSQTDEKASPKNGPNAVFAMYEKGPHTGPAEGALVAIRITGTNPNGTPLTPRYGNGFILRCDGFIVAPFDLFNLTPDSTPSAPSRINIRITVNPGTDHEQQIDMPRRSRYFIDNMRRMGFAVFKMEGPVHSPAARTLLPDILKPGDPVQIVWRAADSSGRAGPLVRKSARIAALPEEIAGEGVVEDTTEHPGRIRLAEPVDGVSPGAIVLGPEGLVVGVMPGAGESSRDSFVSLAALNRVTNSAGPVPVPDQEFRSKNPMSANTDSKEAVSKGKMVRVPGGPVIVPKDMLPDQPDMEGAAIACVAPFEIDRLEVTNDEYLAFWNSIPEKQKADPEIRKRLWPLAWSPVGAPYPPAIGQLPVLGVPVSGALAYARSHGKRLPTPYEWAKAAFGPAGDTQTPEWMTRYLQDRRKAWDRLISVHKEYLRTSIGLLEFARHPRDKDGKAMPPWDSMLATLPWVMLPPGNGKEIRFSFEATKQIVDEINAIWQSPTSVIGVGMRSYDVSIYGAEDMLLNAFELYLPNPSAPVQGAARYLLIDWETVFPEIVKRDTGFIPYKNNMEFPWGFWADFKPPWDRVKLSRLYKRTVRVRERSNTPLPIDFRFIEMISNVNEVSYALKPVVRWYSTVGDRYEIATTPAADAESVALPLVDPGFPDIFTPVLAVWSSTKINYSQELGYVSAETGTLLVPPDRDYVQKRERYPHDLFYILPVGFRCAR